MEYNKQHPLRVVTLCSGYDSQCLALERLKAQYPDFDYELIAWAEFDPESIRKAKPNEDGAFYIEPVLELDENGEPELNEDGSKRYKEKGGWFKHTPLDKQPAVIAHNALFPQWADRNLGDMTKIDWHKVPDFDMLFYSTPCQSISQAGLQHGFTEGSGTRSSIIWYVRDALMIKRPKYACLENVAAMVSAKFLPMFNLWRSEVARLGYTNFAKVLNAKDYNIPQNRERIFLVSVLDSNAHFFFPEKMPLERKLQDVLETKVDTKYYLNYGKVDDFVKDNIEMIQSYARDSKEEIEPLTDELKQLVENGLSE